MDLFLYDVLYNIETEQIIIIFSFNVVIVVNFKHIQIFSILFRLFVFKLLEVLLEIRN